MAGETRVDVFRNGARWGTLWRMAIERRFEQGTTAWKQWRKLGIGASDAPVIMGESPWSSRYELWEQKTGRGEERAANFYMRRGTRLEHVARRLYIEKKSVHLEPVCMEHSELHGRLVVKAMLDGAGNVMSASATRTMEGGARLEACVLSAFQSWAFPPPANGARAPITYSFSFE